MRQGIRKGWWIIGILWLIYGGTGAVIEAANGGNPTLAVTKETPKAAVQRETRMRASGVVTALTDDTLLLERNITGEVMEFRLEKPLTGIQVGDKVSVSYVQREERNTAKRVTKIKQRPKTSPSSPIYPSPPHRP